MNVIHGKSILVLISSKFELSGFDCSTFIVEVEGVIDVQGAQHRKSIQMVTHPDINPIQQGLTLVNWREPVFSRED